jgi:hypothetical protein
MLRIGWEPIPHSGLGKASRAQPDSLAPNPELFTDDTFP